MAARLRGETLDLAWYVRQALEHRDSDAALRALQGCVRSLSPEALAQNGGAVGQQVIDALVTILGPAQASGDSPFLRAARRDSGARTKDPDAFARMWWWCHAMHLELQADPPPTQVAAAERALGADLGADGIPDAMTVVKAYRGLVDALKAHFAESGPR